MKKSRLFKGLSIFLVLCMFFSTSLTGCKKKTTKTTSTKTKTTKTVKKGPKDTTSVLTGLKVTKAQRDSRPFAIMVENTKDAIPQYGLNSASIIYECPVEGGITRLMPIFETTEGLEKIGNVRSCRPYYVYIANEYDAIYTHFGQSAEGQQALDSGLVDEINGLSSVGGKVFYRTSDRKAPHNAYTSDAGLKAGAEKLGLETTYNADEHKKFTFAKEGKENKLTDGAPANKVNLYFFNNKPYFEYDSQTGLYTRYEFGAPHIDKNDGNTITVKNIILQNVTSEKYNPEKGTLKLGVIGSGSGKFITNGKVIDITWKRDSEKDITHYYDKNGKEIVLNPGKTWVSLIEENYADSNTFSGE
ncbi:MAG: DUF3048 domain-containing protein [Lachnospiraceae bacterium]|nr:DUF3048 domain-containing protein [Lachnospiraceae bacterium]